jgi:sugar diacid utilization regulator
MTANLILENVKAYDIDKFDIRMGETCRIELIDATAPIDWFSNNDQVLSIDVATNSAIVQANVKGVCKIQLQSEGVILKTIDVDVYDNIAASLNIQAGTPELK